MSQYEKDQTKWYALTKMHFNMIMTRCEPVFLRSIANKRVMSQCKAISEMLKNQYNSHKCAP